MEDIFENDSKFYKEVLKVDKDQMTDQQYVDYMIATNKQYFNMDRGATDAKKINLGDIKSTKIESPFILNHSLYDQNIKDEKEKRSKPIFGNIKAMIPIMREKFFLEYEEVGQVQKPRYRKIAQETIKEKRVFGIMTRRQVGHIPNVQVSFTEDEENFNRDTYTFKQVTVNGSIHMDVDKEIYKQVGVNEFHR